MLFCRENIYKVLIFFRLFDKINTIDMLNA